MDWNALYSKEKSPSLEQVICLLARHALTIQKFR